MTPWTLGFGSALFRSCAGLKISDTQHLHTDANKAKPVVCNVYPLLARNSTFTQCSKLTLYKLLIRSILNFAALVCSSTCPSNYLRLPVNQSKCLRIIGNYPRLTPTSHLHDSLNTEPIPVIIHRRTATFFAHCPSHPKLLVQQIGHYTVADLTTLYKKYKHHRPKHILL